MDESSLLCEACGYPLTGLDPSGHCPECGRPHADSLPTARRGTYWQNNPSLISWARTSWSVLRHPSDTFARIRIHLRDGHLLLIINLAIASILIVAPWTGMLIGDPARASRGSGFLNESLTHGWVFSLQVAIVAASLYLLTLVEYAGIRFFAARRKWRLTRAAAWQICAHASIGWVLSGLIPLLVLAVMYSFVVLFGLAPGGFIDLRPYAQVRLDWGSIVAGTGVITGYFSGLLAFETLVYKGVRACRFSAALPSP